MKTSLRMFLFSGIASFILEPPSGIEAQRFPVEPMGRHHVLARISSGFRSAEQAHYEMELRGQVESVEVGLRGRYRYTRNNGVLYLVRDIDPVCHLPLHVAGLAVGVTAHPLDLSERREPRQDVMYYLMVQPHSQHTALSLGIMHSLYTGDDFWGFGGLTIHGKQLKMSVEGGVPLTEKTFKNPDPLVNASFYARIQKLPIGFRATVMDIIDSRILRGSLVIVW
jgi:hypothetical protein